MSLQRYRADDSEVQEDGARLWWANWLGGRTYSKIEACRLVTLAGDSRTTVYLIGEADTFFSTPAHCRYLGVAMTGYVTMDDGNLVFRHTYY